MKSTLLSITGLFGVVALASAQGLYYMGEDAQESIPIKWSVGVNLIWDDNVNPTMGGNDDATAVSPFVQVAFVNITPQTTVDLYAKLGAIYYFDAPRFMADDTYADSRLGLNITHRFSERVRLVSRNFVAYELEPDYSYGYANNRLAGEYLYWGTDNAIGFRWTDRFATYTGFNINQIDYDSNVLNQDRLMWSLYNNFRFQLSPQSVLTLNYRYNEVEAGGLASDSTNHYITAGIEHRFSPTTIAILRAGVQIREVDAIGGSDSTSPYIEGMLRSQINDQFSVRSFLRYGIEDWDTVYPFPIFPFPQVEFDERTVLRIGVSGEYAISPTFSLFGGIDYIRSDYDGARFAGTPVAAPWNPSTDLVNIYIGMSMKINDWLYAQASYNYTDSSSDILSQDYDRNRISVGMRAEF